MNALLSIPLTKNAEVFVSPKDFSYLSQFKWHITSKGYAARWSPRINGERSLILMHRKILERTGLSFGNLQTDHINRNKLDSRRENLRLVTPLQSTLNRAFSFNNDAGVFFKKSSKRWIAYLQNKHLGSFLDKYDAIAVRQRALQRLLVSQGI